MAQLDMLGTVMMVCKSPKCAGMVTRQNHIEVVVKGKPNVREWICTTCLTKTPDTAPIAK